jgi:hypothetical protein
MKGKEVRHKLSQIEVIAVTWGCVRDNMNGYNWLLVETRALSTQNTNCTLQHLVSARNRTSA